MSMLTLKDIGKIYVSEGNVAVGIRGVNLNFDRGEFVAITGKSGSGKSTLLNVISGMDSYEEGELYVDGQPTSHYVQSDWEEYRERYISFIFQDYNIIESFTVLQNVELALMGIEDPKQRRARALELIERVGLSSHIHHKGSKLSGGQKQRTVIARALAKDSPIILADEPTGNLDSKTSDEIIELLYEVSRDKLLIVVTHNFDEVEKYATRHVRIFDGAVESDTVVSKTAIISDPVVTAECDAEQSSIKKRIRNGFLLGKTMFMAKPRLTVFLCLLMMVGALGIFLSTALAQGASSVFEESYMFTPIDGRVVITKRNGSVISDDELKGLKEEYGAVDYMHYDVLLDKNTYNQMQIPIFDDGAQYYEYITPLYTYRESFGDDIVGRYPEKANEVFLYLPISYRTIFGKDSIENDTVLINDVSFKVTGVKYFIDNNKPAKCLFTEDGFKVATAIYYMLSSANNNTTLSISTANMSLMEDIFLYVTVPSFEIEDGKLYVISSRYEKLAKEAAAAGLELEKTLNFSSVYYNYDYYFYGTEESKVFTVEFGADKFATERPDVTLPIWYGENTDIRIISDELLLEIANDVLARSYKQASLFFENDKAAHEAAEKLKDAGYVAVTSDTTYEPSADMVILSLLGSLALMAFWFLSILFLAFFLNLCSSRSLESQKDEVAIMRSMGIKTDVIKMGVYMRMLLTLIPGIVLVLILATLVFTSPKFNELLSYLYGWQYALMFVGMLLLTFFTTRKQIANLFGESVKKTMKGGGH